MSRLSDDAMFATGADERNRNTDPMLSTPHLQGIPELKLAYIKYNICEPYSLCCIKNLWRED